MKLLTLNTHSWREENQMNKLKHLAQTIKEKDYDVVALQEVNQMINEPLIKGSHLRNNNFMLALLGELEKIGGPTYYSYWEKSKTINEYYEEGSCVLTKEPLLEVESFYVSQDNQEEARKARKIVRGTIKYKNREIDLYSCHLGWWQDEKEPARPQIDKLMSRLNPDRLSILLGDFNNNANLRGEGYDYMIRNGLRDTYTLASKKDNGVTVKGAIAGWKENKDLLRIDLVLISEDIEVVESQVIFNGEHKAIVSDHYGVEVELKY